MHEETASVITPLRVGSWSPSGHSPVLHCTYLLRIISRVISAHALKNGDLFFAAEPRHGGKLTFSRKQER